MKKSKKFMVRQGDVLVMSAPARPKSGKPWQKETRDELGRVVLAAGEVTGHHHAIANPNVCLLRAEGAEGVSDAVLTVSGDMAELVHEEHGSIPIPRGEHLVRIQREWGGELSRRVED